MFLSYLVLSAAPWAGDPDYANGDVSMEAGTCSCGWFTDPEVCLQTLLSQDCVVVAFCEDFGGSSSSPSDDEAELLYSLKPSSLDGSFKRKGCTIEGEVSRSPSVERLVVATSSAAAGEVKLATSTLPLVGPGTASVVQGTTSFKRRASTHIAVAREAKLGRKEVSTSPIGSLDEGLPLGVLTFIGTCPVIFLCVLPLGFLECCF